MGAHWILLIAVTPPSYCVDSDERYALHTPGYAATNHQAMEET